MPLSLILKVFELSHRNCYAGHSCKEKVIPNIQRFFFWPGLYKWVHALYQNYLDCQKNKQKRKDVNEAPLEPWSSTVPFPFHTVHIDHKGPLKPPSRGKRHCLVVVDAFSRFIQVYPVANVGAEYTIKAFENFILRFGIPQKLVYDRGLGFMSEEFASWTHELGITHAPRTSHSTWTNGKVEIQNKHLAAHFRIFLDNSKRQWADLAKKFAFSNNTTVNSATGLTPYEIVFGEKPQIPLSLKLGLLRNSELNCSSAFCKDLPLHRHTQQQSENQNIDRLLKNNLSTKLLLRENNFKHLYNTAYLRSLSATDKSHTLRNKHKLGKTLPVGRKVLLENHSFQDGKSKKLHELRSGPYTITRKITNVNYEITLDKDESHKRVVHRNHLIEYFPNEEKIVDLTTNYGLTNDDKRIFYRGLLTSQIDKLNALLTNLVFKIHLSKLNMCLWNC